MAPILSRSQLAQANTEYWRRFQENGVLPRDSRPYIHHNLCCHCGKEIDPILRDSGGNVIKNDKGVPRFTHPLPLSGDAASAIGQTCLRCQGKKVFFLGGNIRNIKDFKGRDEFRFEILIDGSWLSARQSKNGLAILEDESTLIWISRQELQQLLAS